MLERAPGGVVVSSSRAGLARSWCLLAAGVVASLLGLIEKRGLELRGLDALLVAIGVPLASAGLVAVLAPRRELPAEAPEVRVGASVLLPSAALVVAGLLGLRALLHAAAAGRMPAWQLGVTVPASCLLVLAGLGRLVERCRGTTHSTPLWRRGWLVALAVAAYMPALGSFGLIDPWESQYSEVAREMLARHDWISLWWGDQGWFWSKPILNFWLQAASFSWFGIDPSPEAMLSAVAHGRWPAPEWAARLPNVALALGGVFVLHHGVERAWGRRAATFGTLLLLACPYWFFLARQTMVDMTLAGPLAACLGFWLLASESSESELAVVYRVELGRRALHVSARELTLVCVAALSLVQLLYLLSRHVSLEPGGAGLSFHVDRVWSGSPGNCALPGNAPCGLDAEASGAWLQPGVAAVAWAACLLTLLWRERREQGLRGLYQLAAWVSVALAFLGKGAPGLVLPLASFVAWLALRGELAELRRAKLPALALMLACITAPWFVQAYARHGMPFFERLFLRDMVQRAFGHIHDTNAGVDTSFRYYVWQLGYGLFPWSGVLAAGALHAVARVSRPETSPSERRASQLFVAWLLAGFGLFSIAGTKFHHYALPLVPAAAALGGAWLAELWAGPSRVVVLGLLAAVMTLLPGLDLAAPGDMPGAARLHQLFTYLYSRPWPARLDMRLALALFAAAASLASLGLALGRRSRRIAIVALCGAGFGFSVWAIDVYLIRVAPHWGQRDNIAAYYSTRRGPDELLVAYRQNWMGENFYTGNHVATFKSAGKPFEDWIAARRREGQRVLFVTTEFGTLPLLKSQLGETRRFDLLTTAEQNNKFVLARVEL